MNPKPPGYQQISPGAYVDPAGHLHLYLDEMLEYLGVQDTKENRDRLVEELKIAAREFQPRATIIEVSP
jgi:hypothetical protein